MSTDAFEVDLALVTVGSGEPARGEQRLVLRRTVSATGPGPAAVVEQVWISGPLPSALTTARLARKVVAQHGETLLLGGFLPGDVGCLGVATPSAIDQLRQLVQHDGASVGYLIGFRGTVDGVVAAPPVLQDGDVIATSGLVAVAVRRSLLDIIDALRRRPTGSAADATVDGGQDVVSGSATALDGSVVRGELLADLADATARIEQVQAWSILTDSSLVRVATADPVPEWACMQRRTSAGAVVDADTADGDAPERDAVVLVFVRVRGGQVGTGNEQINLFRYRLEPRLDLWRVLRERSVREAFDAYAQDPHDQRLRDAAVHALRTARPGDRSDYDQAPTPRPLAQGRVDGTVEGLDGLVVLHDCRGIQVGNDNRQFNTFSYTLAPRVSAGALLNEHPEVAGKIVDYSCRLGGPGIRDVQRDLNAAVCTDASRNLQRPAGAGSVSPDSHVVRGVDGVAAGMGNVQHDSLDVTAVLRPALHRTLATISPPSRPTVVDPAPGTVVHGPARRAPTIAAPATVPDAPDRVAPVRAPRSPGQI